MTFSKNTESFLYYLLISPGLDSALALLGHDLLREKDISFMKHNRHSYALYLKYKSLPIEDKETFLAVVGKYATQPCMFSKASGHLNNVADELLSGIASLELYDLPVAASDNVIDMSLGINVVYSELASYWAEWIVKCSDSLPMFLYHGALHIWARFFALTSSDTKILRVAANFHTLSNLAISSEVSDPSFSKRSRRNSTKYKKYLDSNSYRKLIIEEDGAYTPFSLRGFEVRRIYKSSPVRVHDLVFLISNDEAISSRGIIDVKDYGTIHNGSVFFKVQDEEVLRKITTKLNNLEL